MVASNRFLPNFGRPPSRFGAPLPQERPYDLGERDGRVAHGELSADAHRGVDARVLASEALARHPAIARRRCLARHRAARLYGARACGRRKPRAAAGRAEVTRAVPDRAAPGRAQPPAVSPVTAYAPMRL